jgi:hypothetical protein
MQMEMKGWETASQMRPEEILQIVDSIALQDYRDGIPLAAQWDSTTEVACLDCDCRDSDFGTQPGTYFLTNYAPLIYEGMCIAECALGARQLQVTVAPGQESLAYVQLQPWPRLVIQCERTTKKKSAKVVSHSAETFVHIARLFRREGAEKHLCYVSGCGISPQYIEIPLTSTLGEIASMVKANRPTCAWVTTEAGSSQMDLSAVLGVGMCPNIQFQ